MVDPSCFANYKKNPRRLSYTSEIEFTIKDSKLNKGTSSYTSDILVTITDGKIHGGSSSYTLDIEITIDGNLTVEEFVAVRYSVKYCN